jgi:hypothetical protein
MLIASNKGERIVPRSFKLANGVSLSLKGLFTVIGGRTLLVSYLRYYQERVTGLQIAKKKNIFPSVLSNRLLISFCESYEEIRPLSHIFNPVFDFRVLLRSIAGRVERKPGVHQTFQVLLRQSITN